jgi:hypothetical protein
MTEGQMLLRSLAIVAALTGANPALAEPSQSPAPQPQQQQSQPATGVVLASADTMTPAGTGAPQPAQPKRRIGRVTTCRCGDPQPGDVSQDSPEQ